MRGATDIAARLFLTPGTVRNYLTTVVSKLNARNRVDAIRIATEARLAVAGLGGEHGYTPSW